MRDLESQKLVRSAPPAANATPVEHANVSFRLNTFRSRPAHHPERFLNYVKGRPVVVFCWGKILWHKSSLTQVHFFGTSKHAVLEQSSLFSRNQHEPLRFFCPVNANSPPLRSWSLRTGVRPVQRLTRTSARCLLRQAYSTCTRAGARTPRTSCRECTPSTR